MKTNIQKIARPTTHSFIALFALITASVNLHAATLTVTNSADSGAGTLRAALVSANNGDTINFSLPTPAKITLTSGELLVTKNVSILGLGATNLTLHNGNAYKQRVFHVYSNTLVTITGLTMTNGLVAGSFTNDSGNGGGIWNDHAALIVTDCSITGNGARSGGGVFNDHATLTVNGCSLNGNSAQLYGGGIYNDHGSVVISNSIVSGNSADYQAGGVYTDGSFLGGSGNVIATNGASLRIINSIVSNIAGDAIYQFSYGGIASVQIVHCTLSDNAGVDIFNWSVGVGSIATVDITGSTISKTKGAIMIDSFGSAGAVLCITNCTLSGNSTIGGITAIKSHSGASLHLVNSTISVNSEDFLGAPECIYNDGGTAEIGSTILNTSANGFSFYDSGTVISLGYNLCSDDARGHFLTNATDLLNTDPMLGPLQDNCGPTFTHAPLPGSPAIDKGKNFSAAATDQRGLLRAFNIAGIPNAAGGDGTDIGAVESQDARLLLSNFGVVSNQYGFNLTGPLTNVVVEGSTNLANWTPLVTNALGDAALYFNDPVAPTLPQRFYRARVQ